MGIEPTLAAWESLGWYLHRSPQLAATPEIKHFLRRDTTGLWPGNAEFSGLLQASAPWVSQVGSLSRKPDWHYSKQFTLTDKALECCHREQAARPQRRFCRRGATRPSDSVSMSLRFSR
jgi:hypothetical protein